METDNPTPNIVNFEQWVTKNYIHVKNTKHVFKILTRLYDQAYTDELAMMAKLNGEAPGASNEECNVPNCETCDEVS